MKTLKSVYLYAPNCSFNTQLVAKDLNNKYTIIGKSNKVQDLYNFKQGSIDYLVIFANRKKITNLDKHVINYLNHVFNNIIVVSKNKLNILNQYTFIPKDLINNSLQILLTIIENLSALNINYDYDYFYSKCSAMLNSLGFNKNHKGYKYIIDCSYYIVYTKSVDCLYKIIAQKYNTAPECIERCIRVAINYASKNNFCKNMSLYNVKQSIVEYSNKKFIKYINQYVTNNLK